jgi:hypothetical protein
MPLFDTAREFLAERLGYALVPTERLDQMQEEYSRAHSIVQDAEELSYHALGYFSGRPVEMVFEKRQRLAQRARIAFWQDPLAGRSTEFLADFSLGNGIQIPRAEEERVQQVIDRAWKDPKNEEVLTAFDAQRSTSNTLKTQANVLLAAYIRAGRIRVTWLDADTIRDVVPDPEDELRPLYYVGARRVFKWNVDQDRPEFEELTEDGKPKVTYYKHWRNVEAAEEEREADSSLEPLPVIPPAKQAPGDPVVLHVRTNRLERQHFGIPSAARSLRFYSAMNQFTEARVSKALAAAAFVAKRVMRGGPSQIAKAAGSILQQAGELAEWRGELGGAPKPYEPVTPEGQPPPPSGSWWAANAGDQLESLDLKTGGGEAQADAQIIRAPIAAAEGIGQHYLGDASNANLATASTLELPAMMVIQAWQELLEAIYRWFTDRAIEAAVRDGELGGLTDRGDHAKALTELCISEEEDKAEMERRTKSKLDYKFEMPYPGRRNLPDVISAFGALTGATTTLGLGVNEPLVETALDFLLTHGFQLANATDVIEAIMDAWRKAREEAERELEELRKAGMDPNNPQAGGYQWSPNGGGKNGKTDDLRSQYGERRRTPPPKGDMGESWIPREIRADISGFEEDAEELFTRLVLDPAKIAMLQIPSPPDYAAGRRG